MTATKSLSVLLVDDEEIIHKTVAPYLRDSGHKVGAAYDGKNALGLLEKNDYDLALVDVKMPGIDGFEVLTQALKLCPETAVVLITGHGSMDLAVQALRLGAADFLTKPIKLLELDAVIEKSSRILELKHAQRHLLETISGIQAMGEERAGYGRLIAESPAMKKVREQIRMAAEAQCETILITGETGAGKEVVAREIHFMGGHQSPFIAVSCPALPDTLVESELFGHVKGSFTGATADKAGCFELADGGTLFLDEVADLSGAAQAKLLRVLETRAVRRVGGSKEINVNVRVIAATNNALEELVTQRKFRQDLYYRLNVFGIDMPALREREEDIIPLARYFLNNYIKGRGLGVNGFTAEAEQMLMEYEFPGNVRELRNIVERAAILCREGLVDQGHLNLPETRSAKGSGVPELKGQDEEQVIVNALEKAKWNRRQAAKDLDMAYSTLRYKIKKFGIT